MLGKRMDNIVELLPQPLVPAEEMLEMEVVSQALRHTEEGGAQRDQLLACSNKR